MPIVKALKLWLQFTKQLIAYLIKGKASKSLIIYGTNASGSLVARLGGIKYILPAIGGLIKKFLSILQNNGGKIISFALLADFLLDIKELILSNNLSDDEISDELDDQMLLVNKNSNNKGSHILIGDANGNGIYDPREIPKLEMFGKLLETVDPQVIILLLMLEEKEFSLPLRAMLEEYPLIKAKLQSIEQRLYDDAKSVKDITKYI